MAGMLIFILQVNTTNFVEKWLKTDFIMKGRTLVHIHIKLRLWCFKTVVIDSSLTRVDLSVIHETRVGTLYCDGSREHFLVFMSINYFYSSNLHLFNDISLTNNC